MDDQLTVQVQALIQDAPPDQQTRQMVKNVAIALASFAQGHLNASHYYLVRDQSGAWVKNTLTHRTQSTVEKTAIFIFSTLENVSQEIEKLPNHQLSSEIIPVIELLFRFWTLNLSDCLIVDIGSGDVAQQISRSQISQVIQQEGRAAQKSRSTTSGKGFGKIC